MRAIGRGPQHERAAAERLDGDAARGEVRPAHVAEGEQRAGGDPAPAGRVPARVRRGQRPAGGSVALVVAAQAAHWFDWPRFVVEGDRVAISGALVALVSYSNLIVPGGADAELRRFHHEVVGPYWPPGREHVENGYRDRVMPWPSVEAPPLDMTAEWTLDEVVGYVSSWSATSRLVEVEGSGRFDAFAPRLPPRGPTTRSWLVRWPLTVRLARLPSPPA